MGTWNFSWREWGGGFDERICRTVELSVANTGSSGFTVALSMLHPLLSVGRLVRVRKMVALVLGTRYQGSDICGEVLWLEEPHGAKAA